MQPSSDRVTNMFAADFTFTPTRRRKESLPLFYDPYAALMSSHQQYRHHQRRYENGSVLPTDASSSSSTPSLYEHPDYRSSTSSPRHHSSSTTSIAELSQHFNRHSLPTDPQPYSPPAATALYRSHDAAADLAILSTTHAHRIARRRHTVQRVQGKPRHFDRVASLVEGMMSSTSTSCSAPMTDCTDIPIPTTSTSTAAYTFPSTPKTTSSRTSASSSPATTPFSNLSISSPSSLPSALTSPEADVDVHVHEEADYFNLETIRQDVRDTAAAAKGMREGLTVVGRLSLDVDVSRERDREERIRAKREGREGQVVRKIRMRRRERGGSGVGR